MPKKVLTGADGNTWQKGQSGNPKGRPKKTLNVLKEALKNEGIDRVSQSELAEFAAMILNTPMSTLEALAADKNNPIITRILSVMLGKSFNDYKKLQFVLDTAFGKAQKIDITSNGETIQPTSERQVIEAEVTLNFGLGANENVGK